MTTNIEKLSNDQLKALLFGPNLNENFLQATADYMANLCALQSKEMANSTQNLDVDVNVDTELANATEQQTKEVQEAYAEEAAMQPSSMPSWLTDLVCVFTFLATCITLDPVLIGISGFGMIMQVSGAEKAMADAVSGGDPNKAAAFEFGFGVGMALAGGALSASTAATEAAEVAEEGAEEATQASGYAAKTFSSRFTSMASLKNMMGYLAQSLMQNNFWMDFGKGPLKMSDSDAMVFGMLMGAAFAMGTSFTSEETGLAQLTKAKFAGGVKSLSNLSNLPVDKILRYFRWVMQFATSSLQMTSSAMNFKIGEQYKELANFIDTVLAPAEDKITVLQGLLNGWNSVTSMAQENLSSISNFATQENQTFSALANMFRDQ